MKLLKIFRENFGLKVFVTLSLLLIIVASSFTCLFILHERKELTDNLKRKGELIVELLAYNSRLGVFAENKELLKNSAEAFFQYGEVMSLSIFTTEGKQLLEQRKQESRTQERKTDQEKLRYIGEKIRRSGAPFYIEDASDAVGFWAPVFARSHHFSKKFPFIDNKSLYAENHVIGFAGVVLDKRMLNRRLYVLLLESILMGSIFLVIGFISTYFAVKKIIRPLNKLTENVKALGKGVAVEEIPVETTDEVGRLALAFNTMVNELKQAEKKLISSREQLRSLAARLAEMEEIEKKQLTQIIHDEILQYLTTISINLKVVRSQLPKEMENLIGLHIADSESLLEQTIDYLRNVIADLRPSVLDDLGLVSALRWYGKQFSERTGVNLKVEGEEMMTRLPLATEIALFRISQEALTNIAKHAQANQVTASLKEKAGMIQLNIADDGIGFDYSNNRIRKQAGWGLITMKERATAIGWRLRVESELGKGTQIVVEGKR